MNTKSLIERKWLAIGIILLFVGTSVIPATTQDTEKPTTSRNNWLYVGGSGPGNYTTIQDATDNASDGDTIYIYSGVYYEHHITINKKINLVGENKENTIINGEGLDNGISCASDFINISNITIKFFSYYALGLNYVNHVTIRDVIITFNTFMGICLNYALSTVIANCTIKNNYDGIWAEYCDNSIYIHNRFNLNQDCDIRSGQSLGTLIVENIFENSSVSIFIGDSGTIGISLYHNFFTKNDCIDCGHDSWDNGYPSGGNYWVDYPGTDYYHGPNQNLSGSDGIGDTPYIIPEGDNQDSYPLMEPHDWSNEPPVADFNYTTEGSLVTFNASASYDTDGSISTWLWDFGDGKEGTGEIITHDYAAPGIYEVTVTVVDDDRDSDRETKSVSVEKYDFWIEEQQIFAYDGKMGDMFGRSISIDGDTVLIGANCHKDIGVYSGSVYVFTRTENSWTMQQELLPSDGETGDLFGSSVSLDGDIALIGSPGDDDYTGSVYIFRRIGTTWIQQQKLWSINGAINDHFGCSVSLHGDTAIIGASGDDEGKGSVYVFTRSGTHWVQRQKLQASDGASGDIFGCSVSLDGNTCVIGAALDDDNGNWSGSAYVFTRTGTIWTQKQKLLVSDGTAWDDFGFSVSLFDNTILIGAMYDDANGNGSGSAYVFIRTGSTWIQQTKLLASDGGYQNTFGYSVSLYGDTAFIGSPGDADNSGSTYIFTRNGSSWKQQQKLYAADAIMWDCFGSSVSVFGKSAFIGESNSDNGKGSAYIFTKETENKPPNPPVITGPAEGIVNVETDYNFTTFDPDGDTVFYFIDWSDGSNTSWIGPFSSGDEILRSHSWSEEGTYPIKAKAKDGSGAESDWGTLSVTMPYTYHKPFLSFLEKLFVRFPHAFPILRYLMG